MVRRVSVPIEWYSSAQTHRSHTAWSEILPLMLHESRFVLHIPPHRSALAGTQAANHCLHRIWPEFGFERIIEFIQFVFFIVLVAAFRFVSSIGRLWFCRRRCLWCGQGFDPSFRSFCS